MFPNRLCLLEDVTFESRKQMALEAELCGFAAGAGASGCGVWQEAGRPASKTSHLEFGGRLIS